MAAFKTPLRFCLPALILAVAYARSDWAQEPFTASLPSEARLNPASVTKFVTQHCTDCHNSADKRGGLDLDAISSEEVEAHPAIWEKVIRKLSARQMPPPGKPRPDERTYDTFVSALEVSLDRTAADHLNPGRTPTLRRLNRTEYQNATRNWRRIRFPAGALFAKRKQPPRCATSTSSMFML